MCPFPTTFGTSQEQLQRAMAAHTDEQLQAILLSPSGEYTADAISAARAEYHNRRLDTSKLVPTDIAADTRQAPWQPATQRRQSSWASWIWPELRDEPTARSIILRGFWACIFIVVADVAIAFYALSESRKVAGHYDGWVLVDAALFAIIAWRMWKNSRMWSVIGVMLMVLEIIDKLQHAESTFNVITVLLFLAILHAARGTFALHKLRTDHDGADGVMGEA